MPRLLSALHPREASLYVTGPQPEAARVPVVMVGESTVRQLSQLRSELAFLRG